jgi:predicted RNase H-like HicB family nuclease
MKNNPNSKTGCLTIQVEAFLDEGETEYYFVATCPELNINITCDTQQEAVDDMKEMITATIALMSDEALEKYKIRRSALVNITILPPANVNKPQYDLA